MLSRTESSTSISKSFALIQSISTNINQTSDIHDGNRKRSLGSDKKSGHLAAEGKQYRIANLRSPDQTSRQSSCADGVLDLLGFGIFTSCKRFLNLKLNMSVSFDIPFTFGAKREECFRSYRLPSA